MRVRIYFGTYPSHGDDGEPEGIWQGTLNRNNGAIEGLVREVEISSPSFVTLDEQGSLYAVSEDEEGTLTQFSVAENGTLEFVGSASTQGRHPCHVIVSSGVVVATNYSSGSVFAHSTPLSATQASQGEPTGELFQQFGTGPVADRQEGPHAHFAAQVPGTQYVWVADLGADTVFKYQMAPGPRGRSLKSLGSAVTLPAGSGPRHIAFGPGDLAYVAGELDPQIFVIKVDQATGNGALIGQVPAGTPVEGKPNYPSHIEVSEDGTRLFTAVRGTDTLSVHALDGQGGVELLGEVSVGGAWPRHFRALGAGEGELAGLELVVVANQNSATLDTLAVDLNKGSGRVVSSSPLEVAACVLPVK